MHFRFKPETDPPTHFEIDINPETLGYLKFGEVFGRVGQNVLGLLA